MELNFDLSLGPLKEGLGRLVKCFPAFKQEKILPGLLGSTVGLTGRTGLAGVSSGLLLRRRRFAYRSHDCWGDY